MTRSDGRTRVLHVIPTLEGGGAERQLAYLCEAFAGSDWDHHIALLRGGINLERAVSSGANIHYIKHAGTRDPLIAWRLYRLIRCIRPAIIQSWIPNADLLAGAVARVAGVPWILSERSSEKLYARRTANPRVLLAAGASALVANSKCGLQYWENRLSERVPRFVVRNALPLTEIQLAAPLDRRELGLDGQQQLILVAGRFTEEKNTSHIIHAMAELAASCDAVAYLCGEGPLRESLADLTKRLGIADRVHFPGYVTPLWQWMKTADVFVSLSRFEGMPNAVAEAMACGCPLVLSDIAQHREICPETSAFYVNLHQEAAIASTLLDVLKDPGEAKLRAERAQVAAMSWTFDKLVEQYERVYRGVLQTCTKGY